MPAAIIAGAVAVGFVALGTYSYNAGHDHELHRLQQARREAKQEMPDQYGAPVTLLKNGRPVAEVTPAMMDALVQTESHGNPKARSEKGAIGLTQLLPQTAKEMGVKNIYDPEDNKLGGHKYLAEQVGTLSDETLGLIAYNMGPGATRAWLAKGGDWDRLPKQTKDYVSKNLTRAAVENWRSSRAN